MSRAAIYARFSTDLQSERSVDDQIALCRSFAARERIDVVAVHHDRAKSGASILGRDGLMTLMLEAKARRFDVVLVEHTDRLSRDMGDLADIHKRLTFAGIDIRAIHSGGMTMDTATIGLFGLVGQMQREDGAKKVRRGMAGVVRDGRHAGGRAYGYRPIPGERGRLEIVGEEADVVRRIFAEYVAGRPPRLIAGALNAENIAPPRGLRWNASTINGNSVRGSGIILNELYAGKIVWNKVAMLKNPDTGRRVSRANSADQRATADAPHLRIIDETTWAEAQAVKAAKARLTSAKKRRPVHILSGLLRCGTCGSGLSVHDRDEAGRARLRCSAVRENGSCSNTRRIPLYRIEGAVIDGLRRHLQNPSAIAAYVRAYNAERARLAGSSDRERTKLESAFTEAQRALDRAVRAVVMGHLCDDEVETVLPGLRTARNEAKARFEASQAATTTIALHPTAIAAYLASVEALSQSFSGHGASNENRGSFVTDFRKLVGAVIVDAPPGTRDINLTVEGRLAALIGGDAFPHNVGVRVVAEEGLEPPTRGL